MSGISLAASPRWTLPAPDGDPTIGTFTGIGDVLHGQPRVVRVVHLERPTPLSGRNPLWLRVPAAVAVAAPDPVCLRVPPCSRAAPPPMTFVQRSRPLLEVRDVALYRGHRHAPPFSCRATAARLQITFFGHGVGHSSRDQLHGG